MLFSSSAGKCILIEHLATPVAQPSPHLIRLPFWTYLTVSCRWHFGLFDQLPQLLRLPLGRSTGLQLPFVQTMPTRLLWDQLLDDASSWSWGKGVEVALNMYMSKEGWCDTAKDSELHGSDAEVFG